MLNIQYDNHNSYNKRKDLISKKTIFRVFFIGEHPKICFDYILITKRGKRGVLFYHISTKRSSSIEHNIIEKRGDGFNGLWCKKLLPLIGELYGENILSHKKGNRTAQGSGKNSRGVSENYNNNYVDRRIFCQRHLSDIGYQPSYILQVGGAVQKKGNKCFSGKKEEGKTTQNNEERKRIFAKTSSYTPSQLRLQKEPLDFEFASRPSCEGKGNNHKHRACEKTSKTILVHNEFGIILPSFFSQKDNFKICFFIRYYVKKGLPFAIFPPDNFFPSSPEMLLSSWIYNIYLVYNSLICKDIYGEDVICKFYGTNINNDFSLSVPFIIPSMAKKNSQKLLTKLLNYGIIPRASRKKWMNSKTIVIIDDEPFILSATSKLLQNHGYIVYTCELWAKAASLIRRVSPALVLLDHNMPSIKGDALCKILKDSSLNAGMKIVLFSAEEEALLKELSKECGADGYLMKGIPPAELVKEIEKFLLSNSSSHDSCSSATHPLDTVLLIDDSTIFRMICKQFLVPKYSCKILEASNGLEGLNKISASPKIDLILLDINMPQMNGLEFLQTLQKKEIARNTPVIICSTEGKEDDVLKGLSLGARGYIIKPFTAEALCTLIESILTKKLSM